MKLPLPLVLVLLAAPFWSGAQAPSSIVVEKGPHHRTWGELQEIQTPRGPRSRTNSVIVELQTGLHRWDAGSKDWVETSPRIELFKEGAIVRGLQYSVIFAPNLASSGAVDLQMADGQRLSGHLLGLAYSEGDKSVMIAEVTDCAGEVAGAQQNEIIFRKAFTDFDIDVKYIVARHKFCQDLVIRERLPSPTQYGLTENAHLEVLTEWIAAPVPQREMRVVEAAHDGQRTLTDEDLGFGTMQFGSGQAFSVGDESQDPSGIAVSKGWEQMRDDAGNVRTFLVEKVPWRNVAAEMQKLPPPQAKAGRAAPPGQPKAQDNALLAQATPKTTAGRDVPIAPKASTAPSTLPSSHPRAIAGLPSLRSKRPALKPIQMAATDAPDSTFDVPSSRLAASASPSARRAFVLDYELVLTTTNFTFKADTTYYVSGNVTLSGTNTFEGGTVIKYANTNSAQINVLASPGKIQFLVANYRPIVLTAQDDNSVGARLGFSTGNPTNYYAAYGLALPVSTSTQYVEHVHVRYARCAFSMGSSNAYLRHCQVARCGDAFSANGGSNSTLFLRNVLVHSVTNVVSASVSGTKVRGEHLTVNQATNLNYASRATLRLTNCVLAAVVNTNAYSGTGNSIEASGLGVFEAAGGGAHYLASGSTNRNAGTTNVNPVLFAELRELTTYPPIVLSNQHLTLDTALFPQVQRDTDTPDRGYHYAPLDYLVSGVTVDSNVTVLASGGVAIGIDYSVTNWHPNYEWGSWGFLLDSARFLSEGTPTQPNQIVRAHTAQEGSAGNAWARACFYDGNALSPSNELRMRYTEFSQLAEDGYMLHEGQNFSALEWTHSRIYNPSLVIYDDGANTLACGMTNTLWWRAGVQFWVSPSSVVTVHLRNNLYRLASLHLMGDTTNWSVQDNLFDTMTLNDYGNAVANSHNAYYLVTNALTGGVSNKTLTVLAYQTGPLGAYYYPTTGPSGGLTNLINAGSRNATNASLYHYTTTTNQAKEAASIVDIGLHYLVVTNAGGIWNPIDTDGDGLPDYLEDVNGNGLQDSGETSYLLADTDGDGLPDDWEIANGMDPTVNESLQSGRRRNYEYDPLGRLLQVNDMNPAGFRYDKEGNLTQPNP